MSVDRHPGTHLPECFVTAVKQLGSEPFLAGVSVPDNVHHSSALSVAVLTSHSFVFSSFGESFWLWFAVDDRPRGPVVQEWLKLKWLFPSAALRHTCTRT